MAGFKNKILKNIKLRLVAFDSFSTRSMATFVETRKAKIFIDPGIAIAPNRYGLPPTRQELLKLEQGRKQIMNLSRRADIVTISHYHFDHHPFYDDLQFNKAVYEGKIVYAKNPEKNINYSQKKRAAVFESIASKLAKKLEWCDGKSFEHVRFSQAVWHGVEKSRLGFVVMTIINEKDETLIHTSDVQGPIAKKTRDLIIKEDPSIIILGGPPTYFLGWRFSFKDLNKALNNVISIMQQTRVKTIIIDHHLVRDKHYKERFSKAFAFAEHLGVSLITAAEFNGEEPLLLEARRDELSRKN